MLYKLQLSIGNLAATSMTPTHPNSPGSYCSVPQLFGLSGEPSLLDPGFQDTADSDSVDLLSSVHVLEDHGISGKLLDR